MHLLGFFSPPPARSHGFSLVELLVCLGLMACLAAFAMPSWQRAQERHRVEAVRDQLIADLRSARVRALQIGQTLQLTRLSDCTWGSSADNDWSCGWQLSTKTSQDVLQTSQQHSPLQITFGKSVPFDISARGDLGAVGERWTLKSRQSTLNLALSLCINSASRVRWQWGETCS